MRGFGFPALLRALCCAAVWGAVLLNGVATSAESPARSPEQDFHAVDGQLVELIDTLLRDNPAVHAARDRWAAGVEGVEQARALPDPQLTYRLFVDQPETRVGPQRHGLEVSQRVPWPGKRSLQARRAEIASSTQAWRIRDLEGELVAELKRAYFEAAYLQEALAVNADEATMLRRFEQIALTRYSTGEGIQQNVVKVQTDISRLAAARVSIRRQLDTVTRRVARLIGRPEEPLELRPISLHLETIEYDADRLAQDSVDSHPRIMAALEGVEADRTWVRRRRLDARPDWRFGLGYTDVARRDDPSGVLVPPEDNGKDIWAVTVSVNLPIHRKRIRAGIAEAEKVAKSGQGDLEAEQDALRYRVHESLLRLQSAGQTARLYTEVIIPQAQESLASAEAAYTTNRQEILDLLDAERVLFRARLTYSRLLSDYWKALADIELGVGRKFPEERTKS